MFLKNVGNHLQNCTVSQHRRPQLTRRLLILQPLQQNASQDESNITAIMGCLYSVQIYIEICMRVLVSKTGKQEDMKCKDKLLY